MHRVRLSMACLVLSLPALCQEPPKGAEGIEAWSQRHPEASRDLGEWVRAYPKAAKLFFKWDGHHPERSKEFVTWSLANPDADIEAFAAIHPHWETFDTIVENHRPAAKAFMQWARHHKAAAENLMNHSKGLEWAGHHLFQGVWEMEGSK